MLKVTELHAGYGKNEILKGISLEIPQGKIVTLIGANGSGKTTLLMTLSGIVRSTAGEISLEGKPIEKLPPEFIVRLGITHVPEGRRVFQHLTVKENMDLGAYTQRNLKEIEFQRQELLTLFPILKERIHQLAGNLSGGEQQMLAMARAMMSRPKLLLLDEPSLGLAPKMVETVFHLIREINEQGTTILLVEQNAWMALSCAHYGYVMETGAITLQGHGKELLENPTVRQAYLGE